MNAQRHTERTIDLPVGSDESTTGDLIVPADARAIVVFAHGSGSGRRSSRNRMVAAALHDRGLATFLFDLLTPSEERRDEATGELRFDIAFLAERLRSVVAWVRSQRDLAALPLGYFGASTGAAAALVAAAGDPGIGAIVSRGGRPDLADASLPLVTAPTLLLVGSLDTPVIGMNREASARMTAPNEIVIVPGASHLFEERGTLEEVARLAGGWFDRWLLPR
jgi:putative phosphoribosyl transferase